MEKFNLKTFWIWFLIVFQFDLWLWNLYKGLLFIVFICQICHIKYIFDWKINKVKSKVEMAFQFIVFHLNIFSFYWNWIFFYMFPGSFNPLHVLVITTWVREGIGRLAIDFSQNEYRCHQMWNNSIYEYTTQLNISSLVRLINMLFSTR